MITRMVFVMIFGLKIDLSCTTKQKNKDDKEIVIAYASKSLKPAEKNYPITELKCLAIVWEVEHFHKYLIQKRFTILMDHTQKNG